MMRHSTRATAPAFPGTLRRHRPGTSVITPEAALPPGTEDVGRVGRFMGAGDRPLRYRVLEAPRPRLQVVYLHGIESHGAWFLPVASRLRDAGVTVWMPDRRGSGLNGGTDPGDSDGAVTLLEDLDRFRRHVGRMPAHLAALSWGAKWATAAALDHPAQWRSLSLITPGLRSHIDLPLYDKVAVAMGLLFGGSGTIRVPLEPAMFTTRPASLRFVRDDPWRTRRITARFCLASLELDLRVAERRARLEMPALAMFAGRDTIIDNTGSTSALRRLRPDAAVVTCRDAEHALVLDRPDEVADRLLRHLGRRFP